MKKVLFLGVLGLNLLAGAEMREWSSANGGSTFSGEVVKVLGNTVSLKNTKGKIVTVPISKLSAADQDFLAAHAKEAEAKRRAEERKVSVPYKQGEIVGPITAGSRSSYLLYLPTTLTKSRKAPLLFYTNATGGKERLITPLLEAAEINGWVMAISVESSNNNKDDNLVVSQTAVKHILKTLPVDDDRLYFTGNSGGGAQAFENGGALDACGLMPNIGYIPSGTPVPDGDCFIMNGGNDYNRYTSAHARKKIGDSAVHRLNKGGHSGAPDWMMEDGMFWLQGRYLARKGKKVPEEQSDYVFGMLDWIQKNKDNDSHRAYYWAVFLKRELELPSADQATLSGHITELGQDKNNILYVEGLEAIDRLSLDKLSAFGAGSLHKHTDAGINSACQSLLVKYKGVPVIEETLKAMMKPTK